MNPVGTNHFQSVFGVVANTEGVNDDVILRSKDGECFRVSKNLLSASSGLFQDMFRLPLPAVQIEDQECKDGLAVIPFNDAGAPLLQNLLLFCNPPPQLTRLDEIERVADKYDMTVAKKHVLREKVKNKSHLISSIMISTIGEKTVQNSDTYFAALFVILFPEAWEDVVDLNLLQRQQADALKVYHKDCVLAAECIASPEYDHYKWMPDKWANTNWFTGEHESSCKRGGNIYIGNASGKWMMRYWWRNYIYTARDALKKRPCGTVVSTSQIVTSNST